MKYYTTLNLLRENNACRERYDYLVEHGKIKSDKTRIPLSKILEVNGVEDAIWALRAVEHKTIERDARLFACDCANRVVKYYPENKDVLTKTVNVAIAYAIGKATKEELDAARAAAGAAAGAAVAAGAARAAAGDAVAAERKQQEKIYKKYFCE